MRMVRAYDNHPELAHIVHRFSRRCYCDGCHREKGRRLVRWMAVFLGLFVLGLLIQGVAAVGMLVHSF